MLADARRRRGDRRGRLGRRARARRGRPRSHAGELGLLGDLARGLRRDPLEGLEPARARRRGAQDHGGGPAPAQGDRRDRQGAGGRRARRPRRHRRGPPRGADPPRHGAAEAPARKAGPPPGGEVRAPWARTPKPDGPDRRGAVQGYPERITSPGPTRPTPLRVGDRWSSRPSAAATSAGSPRSATWPRRSAAAPARAAPSARSRRSADVTQAGGPPRHGATTSAPTTRAACSRRTARRKVMERVRAHDLTMKVSDTEWQWDRNKLTIYFTAEKRVDFRALVRDLASLFRTRIELRQIGVRDEAARLSGVGRCGREYCCSLLAHGALAGQPRPRQGPAPLAQPVPDLGRLRPAALLPQVRARVLRRVAAPLSQGREDGRHVARDREGGRRGHLPRAGLSPERGARLAHHPAGPAPRRGRAAAASVLPTAESRRSSRRRRAAAGRPGDTAPEPRPSRQPTGRAADAAGAGGGRRPPARRNS